MIPAAFDYVAPGSLPEAVAELVKHGEEGKVLAGGHSLIPLMKLRLATPSFLVDIGRINNLNYIREEDGHVAIGAMTTHHDIELSELIKRKLPVLSSAASQIGDPQVRNRGTIGGAAAHGDPFGDFPACLLALDAELQVVGPNGERSIQAREFFVDTFTTALEPNEILREIRIATPPEGSKGTYLKFSRRSQDWAIVAVAAQVSVSGHDVKSVVIGLTGMGSKPIRASGVEQALRGKAGHDDEIRAAAEHAAEGTDPQQDLNGSPDYRRHLAKVLTRRALEEVVAHH
ncbi:MAG TPA: xanthine dehydrogenase family protein subunit M [Candidatus Angelobacter sp.]|jgi:carbon-monoxide dehydrogenase medium subunit|nr:xanthine dehydrogenase family protein subunit M [Candidatus Angelobacter sp.]